MKPLDHCGQALGVAQDRAMGPAIDLQADLVGQGFESREFALAEDPPFRG